MEQAPLLKKSRLLIRMNRAAAPVEPEKELIKHWVFMVPDIVRSRRLYRSHAETGNKTFVQEHAVYGLVAFNLFTVGRAFGNVPQKKCCMLFRVGGKSVPVCVVENPGDLQQACFPGCRCRPILSVGEANQGLCGSLRLLIVQGNGDAPRNDKKDAVTVWTAFSGNALTGSKQVVREHGILHLSRKNFKGTGRQISWFDNGNGHRTKVQTLRGRIFSVFGDERGILGLYARL